MPELKSKQQAVNEDGLTAKRLEPEDRGLGWSDSALVVDEHTKPAIACGHSEGHWILDLCAQLPIPREGRWLSFGCGSGGQEMLIAERGLADRILAYDRAPQAVEAARAEANTRGFQNLSFEVGDLVEVDLPAAEFDVVISTWELHRSADISRSVERLRSTLRPGGWLLANEYVGPERFQFTQRQLKIVEELLSRLPERLRWDYMANQRKDMFVTRPESFWAEEAPLEAISSTKIDPTLRQLFESVERRDYGGTLLNPLLEHIVGNFDPESEADATILRLLMYVEEVLMRECSLDSDFAVFAARTAS